MRTLCFVAFVAAPLVALAQQPAGLASAGQPPAATDVPAEAPAEREGHRSQRLKAEFVLQWMQIPNFSFWGARVVRMDPDSPLRQAGVRVGDVVTRLDGTRVSKGKWWDKNHNLWRLPQMERHYGRTELRNIRSGTKIVRNDDIDLGPRWRVHTPGPGKEGGVVVP